MAESSPDIAEFLTEVSQLEFNNRVAISGTGKSLFFMAIMMHALTNVEALIFYDYALTFPTEISEMWNSKFSGAKALFFLARYSFLVFMMLSCAINYIQNPSETFCRVIAFFSRTWIIAAQIGIYGILILRTYAIYQRSWYILVILGLPGVASVAIGVFLEAVLEPEVFSGIFGSTCGQISQAIIPRILALYFDVLLFALTFAKTIRHAIEMRKVGLRNGLGYFILRDGTTVFFHRYGFRVFVVVNVDSLVSPKGGGINWLGLVIPISNPLTAILINRLVLNLRQVSSHLQEVKLPTLGLIDIGTIHEPPFATNSLLGNLGAPLRVGPEDDSELEGIGIDGEAEVVEERGTLDHNEIIEVLPDPYDV
ncbi:hypothetical protein BD410DRAFT_804317 [Rickenella mellea]|uniref:DUF6533 domain-containing protein n=1 Tax=Rickenella mellea TaxID=50990 RepID=A0A4Y7Q176_9AGAM|nr:hypothetical protein BD410DRAFT_804317 [Rickenella mellea]